MTNSEDNFIAKGSKKIMVNRKNIYSKFNKAELRNYIEKQQLEIKKLPGSVYWKNRQGVYLGQNDYAKKVMRKLGFPEAIGQTDYDVFPKAMADGFRESDLMVISGKGVAQEETSILPNGRKVVFLSSKIPLPDRSKNIVGVLGISIDISKQKKLEANLKVALKKAKASNQAKTEFLENMRHDIRTPLSGIVGCAAVVKRLINEQAVNSKEISEYIDDLLYSSDALLDFMSKILESVQVSSGEILFLKKRFNLYHLLEQIVQLNKPQASLKHLKLHLDYDKTIPNYLLGDPIRVQRIVLELLVNALKFTHQGEIIVSASLMRKKTRQLVIKLSVSDTGIGIPLARQSEVYTRFKRLTPSSQGIYPGMGLGLSVVKQFIHDLGGEIQLNSKLDQGSTFTCLIPFEESSSIQGEKKREEIKSINLVTHAPNKKVAKVSTAKKTDQRLARRILVVEDNLIAAKVTEAILSQLDCQIDVVNDGKSALAFVEKNNYDLILMDIGLPDENGYDVTRRIRLKLRPRNLLLPIIGFTAHILEEKKSECIENGMNAIYSKPLTVKKAEKILNKYIRPQSVDFPGEKRN